MEFLWDKNKFINRYYGMQELYQNYIEGYADWNVAKVTDLPEPDWRSALQCIVNDELSSLVAGAGSVLRARGQ